MRTDLTRALARAAVTVLVLVLAFALLPFSGPRRWIGAVAGLAVLVATVPVTVRRVRGVLTSDRPMLDAVQAVVLLTTMLVMGFSAVYFWTASGDPDAFVGMSTRLDAVYFTVTTLSTVGFGDIAARGQGPRAAVVLQIILNFALLGGAVRLLTRSVHVRMEERGRGTSTTE